MTYQTPTTTTQDAFHPMRGHVAKDVTVRMRDGSILTVRPGLAGWILVRENGDTYAENLTSAGAVTAAIVDY